MKKNRKFTTRDKVVIIVGTLLTIALMTLGILSTIKVISFNSIYVQILCNYAWTYSCIPFAFAITNVCMRGLAYKKRSKKNR